MATITNANGKLLSCTGREAVEAFRLKTIISGMRLEGKGIRVNRHTNCTKLAKQLTGLKTNDRAKLEEALTEIMNAQIERCAVVTDGKEVQAAAQMAS